MFLLNSLFLGALTALGALVAESALTIIIPSLTESLTLIVLFVFTEEFFKFLVLQKIATLKHFSSSIFFKSFLMGIGFSLMEITLNIFNSYPLEKTFFWSCLGLFLIHTFTFTLMGYFLTSPKKKSFLMIGLFFSLAFLSHLIFNLFIWYNLNNFLIYFILASLIIYLFFRKYYSKNTFLPD